MTEENFPHKMKVTALGKEGLFHFRVEPWNGEILPIRFRDEAHANSGWLHFDARKETVRIVCDSPYAGALADAKTRGDYFNLVLSGFIHHYRFGHSPEVKDIPTYDADYHAENQYIQGHPGERKIKAVQAQAIAKLASPKKILIAGCSNGELVRQCRDAGQDAWGFDVIPGIEELAFPEVRAFLRHGSVTCMPFEKSDGFDTFVALDVLEHIPERDLAAMISEWERIGISKLVLLINLNEWEFPGHITLRPLEWWTGLWAGKFRHVKTVGEFADLPKLYSNDGLYNHQWIYCERV